MSATASEATPGTFKLGHIAEALQLPLHGDPDLLVDHLSPIQSAAAGSLSFVVGKRFADALRQSQATAVIVPADLVTEAPGACLESPDPYYSYAAASHLLYPELKPRAGVHPTASVGEHVVLGDGCVIGPNCCIDDHVHIGSQTIIGAGTVIGSNTRIGSDCRLFAAVTVYHDCVLGDGCRVQSGAVIGAEGFGYAWGGDSKETSAWLRINQIGRVCIGDHVQIGANTTIDRGALEDTVIEAGVILDNQIQIGHNVRIGAHTAIAGCVGIAGSATIGSHCRIGGKSAIVGHIQIADGVTLGATSFVSRSIDTPGAYASGAPLQAWTAWRKTFSRLPQLDDIVRRLRALEREKR